MSTRSENEEPERRREKTRPEGYWLPKSKMDCETIQGLLFDYMSHELGSSRAELVRAHLLKCDACKRAAADIQSTLNCLRVELAAPTPPARLSHDRRRRVMRAAMHPVFDWVFYNHNVFSIVMAVLVLIGLLALVRRIHIWRVQHLDVGPTVLIDGHGMNEDVLRRARQPDPFEQTNRVNRPTP